MHDPLSAIGEMKFSARAHYVGVRAVLLVARRGQGDWERVSWLDCGIGLRFDFMIE